VMVRASFGPNPEADVRPTQPKGLTELVLSVIAGAAAGAGGRSPKAAPRC
jgi:hypothetical protein